jgi:large subunit ribosomal protein L23
MELDAYQIIKGPVITEKVTALTEFHNIYGFKVDRRANKVQIRRAVEKIWDVKVLNVNTLIRKGKPRRVRFQWSKQPDAKIALVKLAEGQRIEA